MSDRHTLDRIAHATGAAPSEADVFVKTHRGPPAGMYAAEVAGLERLRAATSLRIPRVVAHGEENGAGPAFLALERIARGAGTRASAEALGRGLAELHRATHATFGGVPNGFIATLPQSNRDHPTWSTFYRDERLAPLVARAVARRLLSARLERSFEDLYVRLDELAGPVEPPALVHGDLWSGNALVDERGAPVLIDPSVYFGHREIDLAMMRLFGGFERATFDAYEEAFPPSDGHEARVALLQLYPLLVHVNLFGSGYVTQLEHALAETLAGR